jgi:hypothetical protein
MTDEPSSAVAVADRVSDLLADAAGALLVGLGLLAVASVVLRTVSASAPGDPVASAFVLAFGVAFLVGGVAVAPTARRRLARRHPATTVGRARRVDHRTVTDTDTDTVTDTGDASGPTVQPGPTCTDCGDDVEVGLDTRFREEIVLAGVPLYTLDEGHNYYCADCALAEAPTVGGHGGPTGDAPTGTDTDTVEHPASPAGSPVGTPEGSREGSSGREASDERDTDADREPLRESDGESTGAPARE